MLIDYICIHAYRRHENRLLGGEEGDQQEREGEGEQGKAIVS